MKLIRNMSMKWKVLAPICILAFLLLVTCIQANIASDRMMQTSKEISGHLTEVTPEVEALLESQNSLFEGMRASNLLKLIVAVFVTILVIVVAVVGVIRPLSAMNHRLSGMIRDIEENKGDLTNRVQVRGKDEIGQLAVGINAFIETLQKIMGQVTESSDKLHIVVQMS